MGTASHGKRKHGLLVFTAVLSIYVALLVYTKWLPLSPLAWIQDRFRWNFAYHTWFILIPAFALAVRLASPKDYGLVLPRSFRTVGVGASVFLILGLFPLAGEALFDEVRVQPRLAGHIPQTLSFQFFFSAFGEEFFFRGFIQGSLNAAYGRSRRWGETSYGVGVLVAAILFGVAHLVAPFDPHLGVYRLDWFSFAWTTAGGFLFGVARERGGTLVVPILVHAGINVYQTIFVMDTSGAVGFVIAVCLCYPFLAVWSASSRRAEGASVSGSTCAKRDEQGTLSR